MTKSKSPPVVEKAEAAITEFCPADHKPDPGASSRGGMRVCKLCDLPTRLPVETKPEIAPEDSERIDIEATDRYPQSAIERHMQRYEWATEKIYKRFTRAGRVIDFACGTGYGSAMLARICHEVYGRDKDEEAIRIATLRHSSTLVQFKVRDRIEKHACVCAPMVIEISSDGPAKFGPALKCTCPASIRFDAVVSIETIEHLDPATGFGPKEFLAEAFKLIIPHGLLVLSTPLKDALGAGVLRSKFHLVEFSVDDINKLVHDAGFVDVQHDKPQGLDGFICLTARRPA